GCDRARDAPRVDTVTSAPPSTTAVAPPGVPAPSGWDAGAGPVLLVVGGRPDAAIVVFPDVQGEHAAAELRFDTTALRGAAATLVSRAGTTSAATLGDRTTPGEDEDCVGWPMLRVVAPSAPSGVPAPWTVGLVGARLVPVPLDSVGSLSPADSAALVAEVARLASTVPVRTAAARLRGLPFSVQDVRRFQVAPGVDAIVAQVVRRVHQEANPLEERTLFIAERDSAQQHQHQERRAGRYTLVFHERAVGQEETLEGNEVLAALTPRDTPRPMLIVARESEGGVRYVLLERAGGPRSSRSWRVKWTSALVRC
ncbi:MAG: hypothetical protein M3282_03885, partial [Gemmatimonadota bacterium]|nr:hypothetical protein [Gemmatimonadota bacterium]